MEAELDELKSFAFFVVHFHYTRADYDALTPAERAAVYKEYETMTVSDTTLIRDAVLNATYNANRKRGKPFRKLWKKKQKRADKTDYKEKIKTIQEIEKKEKGWIKRLYKEAGIKPPK